jgi:osmotically-inducible protein OsmY
MNDVIAMLQALPADAASTLAVTVQGAVVTLSGHVGSDPARLQVAELARSVVGVKTLAMEVDVVPPGSVLGSDGNLVLAVRGILQWQTTVPFAAVRVEVRHGWVSLRGAINGHFPRQQVLSAVRQLPGVRGVHDHVAVASAGQEVPAIRQVRS